MNLPAILFSLVIAFLAATLFHILRGGNGWRLLINMGFSALGFWLGQWIGVWFNFVLLKLGVLDIGLGVIGSLVFLGLGDWLMQIKPANKSSV
ncbi:MAG: hypothetical protein IPG80_01240 [Anaerolineales bacterium]|jgi:hypothetical protein|uniref:hypothetical protein n=1 Tax=Candidatus Villigracilis vicinus TaxID=3140679 RepID=UPI003135F465|nr:hypothetical protein [Anaerolineales bacterium]MBK7450598.1 hypothetical protein [Anaerolineales bacterium]MBK9780838.1 hypothetical protein [Anaerolineales bacterium]